MENETKCPICLSNIISACTIHPCEHRFCRHCLDRWLEESSQCPTCRTESDLYLTDDGEEVDIEFVSQEEHAGGPVLVLMPLSEYVESLVCTTCGRGDREETLMICDSCSDAHHAECIGRDSVPRGQFFCPTCTGVMEVNGLAQPPDDDHDGNDDRDGQQHK